jgi:anti-sigma regulatory factor (Ser/Thr protein kinase)
MRTGAARGQVGHFHEAGFYVSDTEFRALIVPFVEEGIAAGEPVIIGYDDRKNALVHSWVTDPSAVTFLADNSLYATPARAIAAYRRLFELHVARGAGQIRITGELGHSGNGGNFEGWDRYEAAVNTVWDDFPVWGLCLYDAATAPAAVFDVVERTHPRLVSASGTRHASSRFQEVADFEALPPTPDPLEDTTPMIELVDASAAEARRVLVRVGRSHVADTILNELLIGVSEAVGNALIHGRAPTTVRIWVTPGRLVISVHDQGRGPADPLAGLVPAADRTATTLGLGLWLIHQLDIDVALKHADDGFTVRLRGGTTMG